MHLADSARVLPLVACALVASLAAACAPRAASTQAAACKVTAANLVGVWTHARGDGFFEEFELARDHGAQTFHSWLHQRPGVGGTWQFDPASCRLRMDAGDMHWDYHVALQGDALHLREDQGDDARYRRFTD